MDKYRVCSTAMTFIFIQFLAKHLVLGICSERTTAVQSMQHALSSFSFRSHLHDASGGGQSWRRQERHNWRRHNCQNWAPPSAPSPPVARPTMCPTVPSFECPLNTWMHPRISGILGQCNSSSILVWQRHRPAEECSCTNLTSLIVPYGTFATPLCWRLT